MSFSQDTPPTQPREPTARERISLSRDAGEAILREIRSLKAQLANTRSKRLLSKREAAKYLGVSRGRTLDVLIAAGRLRTVRIGGRLKIPLEEVERLATSGAHVEATRLRAESAKSRDDFSSLLNRSLKRRGF
jgi:excisionase family DNA binding protein